MTIRSYSTSNTVNTYDAQKDYDYLRLGLLEILYLIGYSESDLDTLTIDEIISGIREHYPYVRVDNTKESNTASELYLKELYIKMVMKARRLWFRYNLAKAALNNA